jgi:hypothetical protein
MTDTKPSIVPSVVAGVVVAAVGLVLWVACYKYLGAVWIGAIGIGLLIGLAMRLVGRANEGKLQVIAAVLAAVSSVAGYLVTYLFVIQWVDPTYTPAIGDAVKRLAGDLPVVLMIAIGAYLAYVLAHRSGP